MRIARLVSKYILAVRILHALVRRQILAMPERTAGLPDRAPAKQCDFFQEKHPSRCGAERWAARNYQPKRGAPGGT
jgi:hypothetical protein